MKNIGSEKDDRTKKEAESLKVRDRETDRHCQKKRKTERDRQKAKIDRETKKVVSIGLFWFYFVSFLYNGVYSFDL